MASKNDKAAYKAEALEKLTEHNRDFLKLDITLPLGNKDLKKVHTNQYLFTELSKNFSLANWTILAKALNAKSNRYSGYVENRWYIESNTITVDLESNKAEMKLGVNAFPSSYENYLKANKEYQDAFKEEGSNNNNDNNDNGNKNTTNAVVNGDNNTVKSGWWGKWIEQWVRGIVGTETDPLKKAKMIYETFRNHVYYHRYCCALKTKRGDVNSYEAAYKDGHLNCGDGANILCAAYNCAGVESKVMHTSDHFIVRSSINGNYYWTDCAGAEGAHDNHGWNEVYGYKGGDELGYKVTCEGYSC